MKTKITNSLDNFKLFYEDMEKKKVKILDKIVKSDTVKTNKSTKAPLKTRISTKLSLVRQRFSSIVKKSNHPSKKVKKTTKAEVLLARQQRKRAILGIGQLLVVVSITFSTFVTHTFVDGSKLWIALAPQIAYALFTLIKAFSKLYK